jgi:hypothetical protein
MVECILISDGEDDIISVPGPSRPRPRITAPIFIDDSDDDGPPVPTIDELLKSAVAETIEDRHSKRKASVALKPTRVRQRCTPVVPAEFQSTLLDLLDSEDLYLDAPACDLDLDIPLATEAKKRKNAAKKQKTDTEPPKDKEGEAARKRAEKEAAKNAEKEAKARQKEEDRLAKEVARSRSAKEKDVNKVCPANSRAYKSW